MKSKLSLENALLRACERKDINTIKSIIAKDRLVYIDNKLTRKLLDLGGRELLDLMYEKGILRINNDLIYCIITAYGNKKVLELISEETKIDEAIIAAIKCDDFYLLRLLSDDQDSDLCIIIRRALSSYGNSNTVANLIHRIIIHGGWEYDMCDFFSIVLKSDEEKIRYVL